MLGANLATDISKKTAQDAQILIIKFSLIITLYVKNAHKDNSLMK